MGSIAGRNGTGVAPESEWMHCRAFEGSSATEEALLVCGQYIVCPTLPDGKPPCIESITFKNICIPWFS